jgi:cobyrinic acid a,c-diamide synthase
MRKIIIDHVYTFAYPDALTTLPEYSAHRGQRVTVVRRLTDDECDLEVQPMYLVRALDGWEGHAGANELK